MGEIRHSRPPRDLVLVASGLEPEGGGRAVVGRLLCAAAGLYSRQRGVGLSVLHLGADAAPEPGVPVRSFGGDRRAFARAIWRSQLRRRRPALLFDLVGPARAQLWLPPFLRGPYGVMLLGVEVFGELSAGRRRALRGASLRLAISAYTRERARRQLPADAGAVEVLHLTLEERWAEGVADPEILERAGGGFILIVGRMDSRERYKGHDELLAALAELARRRPEARLVVAGDGDDRPRLEARAASLGVGDRVLFTGFVGDSTLRELYRRAAVFAMPSRGEGFGLVYLEAMRAGKPCVAARGGAAEEIIEDDVTGLLVDAGDPVEVAAALSRLLGNPEEARRLGAAGRRRFAESFSPERFRRGLFEHLDRLTGAPPPITSPG